jgi:hypothetical protein
MCQCAVCYVKVSFFIEARGGGGGFKIQRLLCDESDQTGTHCYVRCSIAIMAVL